MLSNKIINNVFSNWAGLVVSVIIAFVVSPVILKSLGKEIYGIWTLIVSITGYFTVLDFGVNTAIVRYISRSVALKDYEKSRAVYSTSMVIFGVASLAVLLFSLIFGYFFQDVFNLYHVSRSYLYVVFLVSSLDLAGGLICSVFMGTLIGLQEFRFINSTSILINIIKSTILVLLLKHGYTLLTLASLQLAASAIRSISQFALLKIKYNFIAFSSHAVSKDTLILLYDYSVFSFVIAVALKLLFYTDSVVIGAMIGVSSVAFYAIPSTLLDYLEKFVWAMIAVLVPVISANEAKGQDYGNVRLYIVGTRYTLLISMPIVIALYSYGSDFISLWMGPEFGLRSSWVLRILLIGFGISFSQLIAHGILKGISKHKVLAYILAIEALVNLIMSLILAKPYGIEGVAVGTMVPLILASISIIIYCCRTVGIGFWQYLFKAHAGAISGMFSAFVFIRFNPWHVSGYVTLFFLCIGVAISYLLFAIPLCVEKEHRDQLWKKLRRPVVPVS